MQLDKCAARQIKKPKGRQRGRLPDCDGKYRCLCVDCNCPYQEGGFKGHSGTPQSGYPKRVKNTAFKQHIYAQQKSKGGSKDDLVVKGPYKDQSGHQHFGRHAPNCPQGARCFGSIRGWRLFTSDLPTVAQPEMDVPGEQIAVPSSSTGIDPQLDEIECIARVEQEGGIPSGDPSIQLLPTAE
jgi:hypothetical protein